MNCEQVQKHLPDFFGGELPEKKHRQLEEHLQACEACGSEVDSLEHIWTKLAELPEERPSPMLRQRFNAMLEAYQAGQHHAEPTTGWREAANRWLERWWPQQPVLQLGFAVALLLIGLFFGHRLNLESEGEQDLAQLHNEVQNLRQLVTTALLQNQSPTERLRGVSYSYRMDEPDQETLSVLLNTLNYDSNLNVRLAAIDALSYFYDRPMVRRGIIEALGRQTSPLIQIALINLLVERQEQKAVDVLKVLKENEMFNQTVRERAAWAIDQLQVD